MIGNMVDYYTKYVISEDVLNEFYGGSLCTIEKEALENKLLVAGILSNVKEYGDISLSDRRSCKYYRVTLSRNSISGKWEW